MTKCAVAGGVTDCWPLGDGRCGVEGNYVPCPLSIRAKNPIKKSCWITWNKGALVPVGAYNQNNQYICPPDAHPHCIPIESNIEPKLETIEDMNSDGFIDPTEVDQWLRDRYETLWPKAVFPTCEGFNKENAVTALKKLNRDMFILADIAVYTVFSGCDFGEGSKVSAGRYLEEIYGHISRIEKEIIDSAISAAADQGAGQLGMTCETGTGEIVSIRKDSDGEKGGLRVGDRIISVDGFKYSDTVDYQVSQWWSSILYLSPWFSYPKSESYKDLQKVGMSANALFFGPCGSTAALEIERNGERMSLQIKRGRG